MEIEKMLLTPNQYSRPQIKLSKVNGVVVHYVGNSDSTAIANRNYFESLKDKKIYASSHYIIGLEGEIIQCVPENEIAYCSNSRNKDTISIECCHPTVDGKFNDKTLGSLSDLLRYLIKRYNLESKDIIRHYDITKKKCPLYFVNNSNEWERFKEKLYEEDLVTTSEFLYNGNKIPLNRILYKEKNYIELRELSKLGIKVEWDNINKIPIIII